MYKAFDLQSTDVYWMGAASAFSSDVVGFPQGHIEYNGCDFRKWPWAKMDQRMTLSHNGSTEITESGLEPKWINGWPWAKMDQRRFPKMTLSQNGSTWPLRNTCIYIYIYRYIYIYIYIYMCFHRHLTFDRHPCRCSLALYPLPGSRALSRLPGSRAWSRLKTDMWIYRWSRLPWGGPPHFMRLWLQPRGAAVQKSDVSPLWRLDFQRFSRYLVRDLEAKGIVRTVTAALNLAGFADHKCLLRSKAQIYVIVHLWNRGIALRLAAKWMFERPTFWNHALAVPSCGNFFHRQRVYIVYQLLHFETFLLSVKDKQNIFDGCVDAPRYAGEDHLHSGTSRQFQTVERVSSFAASRKRRLACERSDMHMNGSWTTGV
jgi:hypothetical protein